MLWRLHQIFFSTRFRERERERHRLTYKSSNSFVYKFVVNFLNSFVMVYSIKLKTGILYHMNNDFQTTIFLNICQCAFKIPLFSRITLTGTFLVLYQSGAHLITNGNFLKTYLNIFLVSRWSGTKLSISGFFYYCSSNNF